MQRDYIQIGYRDIAKMFAKHLPVENEEFGEKVNEYLEVIKAMPQEQKTALKVAYVFSAKVPREEQEDFFQDLTYTLLKLQCPDEKLAYAVARCDWKNWFEKYKIRQHFSLDSVAEEDEQGNPVTLAETLVGEVEFETKVNGKMDAELIWNKLPAEIKPIVRNRLIGKALTSSERNKLNRFVRGQGTQLLLA